MPLTGQKLVDGVLPGGGRTRTGGGHISRRRDEGLHALARLRQLLIGEEARPNLRAAAVEVVECAVEIAGAAGDLVLERAGM